MKKACSVCQKEHQRRGQRYCLDCHAAYMRENRPSYDEMTPEQRRRSNCRAYTNTLIRRGQIERGPCEVCGDPNVQPHHEDYSKPRKVRWRCRKHHLSLHAIRRRRTARQAPAQPAL